MMRRFSEPRVLAPVWLAALAVALPCAATAGNGTAPTHRPMEPTQALPWNFHGAEHPPVLTPGRYAGRLAPGDERWFALGAPAEGATVHVEVVRVPTFHRVPDPTIEGPDRGDAVGITELDLDDDVPGGRFRGGSVDSLWVPFHERRGEPGGTILVESAVVERDGHAILARDGAVLDAAGEGVQLGLDVPAGGERLLVIAVRADRYGPGARSSAGLARTQVVVRYARPGGKTR